MSRQLRTPEQLKEFKQQSLDDKKPLEDEEFNRFMNKVELRLADCIFPFEIRLYTYGLAYAERAYKRMVEEIATGYQTRTDNESIGPVNPTSRLLTVIRPWDKHEQPLQTTTNQP